MSRKGDAAVAAGRMRKANQFFDAAGDIGELADDEAEVRDAVTTLLVHAGIAAADVICIDRLGEYALGNESHDEAVALFGQGDGPRRCLPLEVAGPAARPQDEGWVHTSLRFGG